MAPSSCIDLTLAEQEQLLRIARDSIATALRTRQPPAVDAREFAGALARSHGNFVTLTQHSELRGCVGMLTGRRALVEEIAISAYNAAFRDSRFAPLAAHELHDIRIDISVLSQPQELHANNLTTLLERVQPQQHGLIVEEAGRRGTLLPKVWEKLSDPREFITQLLLKAGLPPGYWSDTIRFYSYEAFWFAEE